MGPSDPRSTRNCRGDTIPNHGLRAPCFACSQFTTLPNLVMESLWNAQGRLKCNVGRGALDINSPAILAGQNGTQQLSGGGGAFPAILATTAQKSPVSSPANGPALAALAM